METRVMFTEVAGPKVADFMWRAVVRHQQNPKHVHRISLCRIDPPRMPPPSSTPYIILTPHKCPPPVLPIPGECAPQPALRLTSGQALATLLFPLPRNFRPAQSDPSQVEGALETA